jgi:hypothetical protein
MPPKAGPGLDPEPGPEPGGSRHVCRMNYRRSEWPPDCPMCFYSNAFMALPICIALANDLNASAALMALAGGASAYYHLDECNIAGLYLDVFSVVLVCANGFYMLNELTPRLSAASLLACVFMAAACACYIEASKYVVPVGEGVMRVDEGYDHYHALWHVFVSFASAALVYSYAMRGSTFLTTDRSSPVRSLGRVVTASVRAVVRPISGLARASNGPTGPTGTLSGRQKSPSGPSAGGPSAAPQYEKIQAPPALPRGSRP